MEKLQPEINWHPRQKNLKHPTSDIKYHHPVDVIHVSEELLRQADDVTMGIMHNITPERSKELEGFHESGEQ